jgi:hypothetical protein
MSKKSKSTTSPWKPAQPFILGGAGSVRDAYDQNSGNIQDATDQITGLLPEMIEKYRAGNPAVNAATGYNTDVLSGRYLNEGNPYLDQMLGQSNDDIRNQLQASLGAKGLTGGSSYADIISRNIAKNTLATRYGAYNDERGRMGQAAGQAPGLAAADVIQITPMMAALQAAQAPIDAAGQYAGSLGGLFNGYGTQTQKQGAGSTLGGLLGSALSGWAGGGFKT